MKVRERTGKMTNTFEQLKMEFSVDKKQMLRRENVSNIEMYLILLNNTFEQLKQLKKNSQLTRNRCRGEKMYSCLGEYWEEALAYIVILAYFLWGRGWGGGEQQKRVLQISPFLLCTRNVQKYDFLNNNISSWNGMVIGHHTYLHQKSI